MSHPIPNDKSRVHWCIQVACVIALTYGFEQNAVAGQLTIDLDPRIPAQWVGAICRWDRDGNRLTPVDPKEKIGHPKVTATARKVGQGSWEFQQLAPGRYDIVILAEDRLRIEGFHYPPILEFDPLIASTTVVPKNVQARITSLITKSRHYENKVTPIFMAGDKKQVRVLMKLLRDKPTSFDREYGAPVATLRHEVWQFSNRYGTWSKEKRTKVLNRLIMAKRDLEKWSWTWTPDLGGIDIGKKPRRIRYTQSIQ